MNTLPETQRALSTTLRLSALIFGVIAVAASMLPFWQAAAAVIA